MTSIIKDDLDDSNSDFVEEFAMVSGSHSSTLDRLHAWERKLYDEIKVHHKYIFSKLIKYAVNLKPFASLMNTSTWNACSFIDVK